MIAAFCTQPGSFELRDIERPAVGAGEALVKIRSCGICGSDVHFFQGGFAPPPVCPGHEISGEVVEVGPEVTLQRGDRVAVEPLVVCQRCPYCRAGNYQLCQESRLLGTTMNGGFAEYLRMPASALFLLPAEVDFAVGALTEPLAVAVHAVRLAGVQLSHRVLVIGGGTIGLMAVAAARAAGAADVWISARYPQQSRAAESLGATHVFSGAGASRAAAAAASEQPIDVVIETVGGTADTLTEALQLARPGGTIAVLGLFANTAALDVFSLVVRELRVVGSLTYGRAGLSADFDIALQLLAAQPERFRQLITHAEPLQEITRGFAIAADKRSGAIKVAIRPE
jgi:2-desacetyl-2-hydroxyethyl bacteriochlorophyllide A dehydrogenase